MTYKLYPNVTLGEDVEIGDFVVLGLPPRGAKPGELPTVIGPHAVIRSHTVIYAGNIIGAGFQTGHGALVREENRIGDNVSIGSHSVLEHHITVGDGVRIHSQAFVPEFSVLEEECWLGPNVVLTNAKYPASRSAKEHLKGPIIRRRARLGANVTVLPGVEVGANALVGAGAVVVSDVMESTVVVGNPARSIGDVGALEVYDEEVS